jgi:hypothetical protein
MRAGAIIALIAATLPFTGIAYADGPADRTAIETVIHSLKTAEHVSDLFTADADSDLNRLRAIEQNMNASAHTPWSETGPPVLLINTVRFISADVAIVNAAEARIGPIPSNVPVLFVMKKETSGWKIALLRVVSPDFVSVLPSLPG